MARSMLQGALVALMVADSHAFSAPGFAGSSGARSLSAMCGRPSQRLAHATLAAPRLRGPPALAGLSMASEWYTVEKLHDVEGGARYKYTITVAASVSKEVFGGIMKDFKKNAQFPGFRKGTIPPFMIPKVKTFVVQDCLEKTLGQAVTDQSMTLISADVKPTLDDEQTKTLTKNFKETEAWTYIIEAELKPKYPALQA